MFGLGEQFPYLECDACGSLSLVTVPPDFGRFYPSHYYSFHTTPAGSYAHRPSKLRTWALRRRNEAQLFGRRGLWGWVARVRPRPDLILAPPEVALFPCRSLGCRILDVGCGDAVWLRRLQQIGFWRLLGSDPFLKVEEDSGIRLKRCDLQDLPLEPFDVIRFNHSIEHVEDPLATLRAAVDRLVIGGVLIVSTPIAGNWLWRTYGVRWVELDAPRHIAIPSLKALISACDALGLNADSVTWEEVPFELWATDLYARGITLVDPETREMRRPEDYFSEAELLAYRAQAVSLNASGEAGRARIVLTRRR